MNKKDSRQKYHQRQRQRMSRKLIIILGSSIACLFIALVTVFNMSNVDEAEAAVKGLTSSQVIIIPEPTYSVAVNVNEPPVARTVPVSPDAQLGRIAKPLPLTD